MSISRDPAPSGVTVNVTSQKFVGFRLFFKYHTNINIINFTSTIINSIYLMYFITAYHVGVDFEPITTVIVTHTVNLII